VNLVKNPDIRYRWREARRRWQLLRSRRDVCRYAR